LSGRSSCDVVSYGVESGWTKKEKKRIASAPYGLTVVSSTMQELYPNAYVKSPIFACPCEGTDRLFSQRPCGHGRSSRETPTVVDCGEHYSGGVRTNAVHSRTKFRRKWETGREDQGDSKKTPSLRMLGVKTRRVGDDKNSAHTERPRIAYI